MVLEKNVSRERFPLCHRRHKQSSTHSLIVAHNPVSCVNSTSQHINTIMKLSCVLLLALAPVNAVDYQPQAANLRGIAAIALSDEESAPVVDGIDFVEESRYGGGPPHNSCREIVGQSCSTSSTAPTSHKCCNNLTCQSDDTVSYPFDGKCAEATAPGEIDE
jgi:hypothetical protein